MDRAAQCPASVALPGVHETSDYAADGNDAHSKIESVLRGKKTWQAAGLAFDPHACLPKGDHHVEVPYAYDPIGDYARVLVITDGHRSYDSASVPVRDTEIPMTLDVVTRGDDGWTITDWKTGFLGKTVDTLQLTIAALSVARAHRAESVTVQIAHVLGDGRCSIAPRTLDALDLDAAADAVRRIQERAVEARALVASGRVPETFPSEDGCRYCPALAFCPAHISMARSVLATTWDPATVTSAIEAMTIEEAGALWLKLKSGEKMLEAIGKSLRARAEAEPLSLPDGRVLKMVQQTRTSPVLVPSPDGAVKTSTFFVAKAVKRAS